MLKTITPDIVVGYLQCQRKGFLLLNGKERGNPHGIDAIIKFNLHRHRHAYKQVLRQEGQTLQTFTPKSFLSGLGLFVNAQLVANGLESYCDALTKQSSTVNHDAPFYEPTLVSSGHSVQPEDKIRLQFSAHVLTQVQGRPPKYGFLVTSRSTVQKVTLENNCKPILRTLAALREWIESTPQEEPRVMLNKHCSSCQFRLQCKETAERLDDLSLLDRMTPKALSKYTRRILGFGLEREYIDGLSVCRMFNQAVAGQHRPKHLSTDQVLSDAFLRPS